MLLSFPYMHQELWIGEKPEGLIFFDPGLTSEPVENGFRPEGLPLAPKMAKALINDCINFGEQFKDPSEMAYFGAVTVDDFYEGSSMSIQAQLTRSFDDMQGSKEERADKEALSRAQFVLLLGWFFEERIMELQGLENGIRSSWKTMDQTLGVDDDDRLEKRIVDLGTAQSHTGGTSDGQTIPLPWKRIAESLPVYLAEGAVLVCSDPEILAVWEELGIEFKEEKNGLPAATLPAWQFAGRRRAPEDTPNALLPVTVAIIE